MKSATYGQTIKQASFQVLPASGFHIIKEGFTVATVRAGEGGKRGEGKRGAHVCPPGAPGSG